MSTTTTLLRSAPISSSPVLQVAIVIESLARPYKAHRAFRKARAQLMALDDRIVAAAPACYLTTFRRLIETKGAQDAEQNIFGQIAFGFDEPDYVMMRAPKPTLICAGTRDVTFDIEGTWDLFRQSKRFYSRLGFPERVELNEADAPHGFYLQQREAAARWMHR